MIDSFRKLNVRKGMDDLFLANNELEGSVGCCLFGASMLSSLQE